MTDAPSKQLAGRTILVTRAADQAGELTGRLESLGARVLAAPAIATLPVVAGGALDRAIVAVAGGEFDWVAYASANAVRYWFERARAMGFDARAVRAQVAAVGPGTAAALEPHGIVPNLVPRQHTGAALARAFPAGPGRVLVPRTTIATPALVDGLRARGWTVRPVAAYRTVRVRSLPPEARGALRAGNVDALAFTSASTVDGFLRMARGLTNGPRVVAIGPETARTARERGLRVHAVANPHTLDGLVEALARVLGKPR